MDVSTTPSIFQATDKDIDRLAGLICSSFADVAKRFQLTPENCPKHPSNYTCDWVEKDLARGVRYFILTMNHTDVGCVGVEKAPQPSTSDNAIQAPYLEAYMERLAVLPQHRGKGYGTRLARHPLNQAQSMGATTVSIGIIAVDTGLKDFYKGLGFEEGQTKTFPHLPFDVAFMKLWL